MEKCFSIFFNKLLDKIKNGLNAGGKGWEQTVRQKSRY
jgi:hypothetical protein